MGKNLKTMYKVIQNQWNMFLITQVTHKLLLKLCNGFQYFVYVGRVLGGRVEGTATSLHPNNFNFIL